MRWPVVVCIDGMTLEGRAPGAARRAPRSWCRSRAHHRAEVSPARANDLITAVFREAADLASAALPDEELRALRAGRARVWETSLSWVPAARDLASETWRCRIDVGALTLRPDQLRAVTAEEVRYLARTYLDPAAAQVFVMGPREQLRLGHPALAPAEAISWSDSEPAR